MNNKPFKMNVLIGTPQNDKLVSMPVAPPCTGHFFIAEWTIEPDLNAISKDGLTIHLEPKVMKVLLQLAMAPGQVLSKERLIEAVWSNTFVSDDVLTRCISVLRREMHDDPHAPRYIQTIPKTGYRLVAEVRCFEPEENHFAPAVEEPVVTTGANLSEASKVETQPGKAASSEVQKKLRYAPRWLPWLVLSAAIVLIAALGFLLWRKSKTVPFAFNVIPLTSYTGQQDQGAFSPDGTRVVFVWSTPEDNNGSRNLFIKQVGSETLLRLTNSDESDYSPTWSPDGTKIAYLSFSDKGLGLYVISSLGGPPQKLYTPQAMVHWEQRALSWSPDGKSLIFPDGMPSGINMLSVDTLQTRALTVPPHVWDGDVNPAFSPDGKEIAFIRAIEGAVRDIYIVPTAGGTPRQLTNDRRIVDTLAWTRDSSTILFSSDRGGKFALWKIARRGGKPQRLPFGTENATQPAVSLNSPLLLYTEGSATWSILGIHLHPGSEAKARHESSPHEPGKADPVVSSTEQDSAPSFAPDGSRFAFQSWRSGSQELWIASRDGQTLRQLTSYGKGLTGSPSFSPDGQQVAFDARPEGHSHIFVVSANGGTARELTTGNSNDILPRWSADGQSLYFASNRSGAWQTWKIALANGKPQQITTKNGYLAMESPDGLWIYFTKNNEPGIWRIAATGSGPKIEERILPQPADGYWGYWAVTTRGIYFLNSTQPVWKIQLWDPKTQRISTVVTLDRQPPPFSGISVARDGDELLITDKVNASSHITLVQNFP
jgi:Tol biopolymer transport system component/DNA-binding winged helix-turn-helix (wHTH) protein